MSASLYNIVDRQYLHDMLKTFHHCMELPIQVLDEQGNVLDQLGESHICCRLFQEYFPV